MGIVFAVLALLSLSIKGLSMLDREPVPAPALAPQSSPAASSDDVSAAPSSSSATTDEITGEQVAAIAVALALSEPQRAAISSVPGAAAATAGSWLQSGRMRSLGSNKPATPITQKRRNQ